MTRINCISPDQLTDQHLLAEHREIFRIPSYIARSKQIEYPTLTYTMGAGHVKFFYAKGRYLQKRSKSLYYECIRRGFEVKYREYDIEGHPAGCQGDWIPKESDVSTNLSRLVDKLKQRPMFYRYCGGKENVSDILNNYLKVLEKYVEANS